MGKDSKIEWTDHTFNPWWGCQRWSEGCLHCYAEVLAERWGHHVWGPAKTTPRRLLSDDNWKQPTKWNKTAAESGTRARVFCASMADVFEDHPQIIGERARLWQLIDDTPFLDWLLLTKRPENILSMIPREWRATAPPNVWYGTSCENQEQATLRIPYLAQVPAVVRWLSCEPLLGPIDLEVPLPGPPSRDIYPPWLIQKVHWVIAGGESGHHARPMHPSWAQHLRDQCLRNDVAYHFKQWGEHAPFHQLPPDFSDHPEWPAAYLIQHLRAVDLLERPGGTDPCPMYRVGKKAAGRLLDGRTWDEYPQPGVFL